MYSPSSFVEPEGDIFPLTNHRAINDPVMYLVADTCQSADHGVESSFDPGPVQYFCGG